MSTQVTTAFVEQYKANVQMLVQQAGSKLRGLVDEETITGKNAFFDQIGATAARLRITRHADTPQVDTPHARRRVSLADYDWADLIDQEDKVRMLIDPTSSYAKAAANAMGRAMDAVIVDAIRGTAYTGVAGGTSTVLPSAQKVATGSGGLTIVKLINAKKRMDLADVPSENRFIAVTGEQIEDLLNTTQVTSADFNTVKALVSGEIDTFLGFKFVQVNGSRDGTTTTDKILPISSTTRYCVAWQKDMVKLAIGADVMARITERPDKNHATQVFYSMAIGATRMQESGVVEVACTE